MATNFWASSHYQRWIVDRATLRQARSDDLKYIDDPQHLEFLSIFFAGVISRLCKKLQLRQRVIATATVFFRRFYLKNSYCETEPFMVIAACCYVAAKAEESPLHIKAVVSEARSLFNQEIYGAKSIPSDNSKLAEMEFYLIGDLECDLIVFHPYRTLLALCRKSEADNSTPGVDDTGVGMSVDEEEGETTEEGNQRIGINGKLELHPSALQMAWFIINDTYRTDLCLLYPPHLIAITAIYLTAVLNIHARSSLQAQSQQHAQKTAHSSVSRPTIVQFFASLNVNMPLIATIAQEIIGMYALWDRYPATSEQDDSEVEEGPTSKEIITSKFLIGLLAKMREARASDIAHTQNGKPMAESRRLKRATEMG